MTKVEEYQELTKQLSEMRHRHEQEEGVHLDKMDALWDLLSESDIKELHCVL